MLSWDHPRGCGENSVKKGEKAVSKGSPPRMRGKLASVLRVRGICGITPADAGKTVLIPRIQPRGRITPADAGKTVGLLEDLAGAEDHPRGCGENAIPHTRISAKIGSPPRMRGKR